MNIASSYAAVQEPQQQQPRTFAPGAGPVARPARRANTAYSAAVRLLDEVVLHTACRNYLLAVLPEADLRRWLPHLEYVELPQGQVLGEAGSIQSHVYFPVTAIVSLLHVTESGDSVEIGVIGNDGLVGLPLFTGGASSLGRAVVQGAGYCFRMPSQIFILEVGQPAVMRVMLLYTQALMTQMAQTVSCNRHHSIDQKLCRRLLLSLDRSPGAQFEMTQEMLSNILGVRREGVTVNAVKLQRAKLIRYARGRITVLDRAGLEERACECYAMVKKECARLLPGGLARAE